LIFEIDTDIAIDKVNAPATFNNASAKQPYQRFKP